MQYRGIANVHIEGDYSVGRKHIAEARRMLSKLQRTLEDAGVASGGLHGPLSDTAYCYVRVAGDVNTIHIVADRNGVEDGEIIAISRVIPPDFLSGTIRDGYITEEESETGSGIVTRVRSFSPTVDCATRHELPRGYQPSKRLAVEPYTLLADDLRDKSGNRVFSQYTELKPSMYSGTMAKLVQFLMGYGKADPKKSIYQRRLVQRKGNAFVQPPTAYEKDVKKHGVQIRYDWRFHKTHGLVRAYDGKWWVVQIRSGRGIHAMPLKLHPSTTTEKFREQLEDDKDASALGILDLFGGFPTGESLPSDTEELDAWVRSGFIVQGADSDAVQGFYSRIPYSPWVGWAFSESGREAHNTAYYYGADGVQRGVHYSCSMTIGETEKTSPHGSAENLKRHIAAVAKRHPKRAAAAFFKIDRMDASDIAKYLRTQAGDAWDEIDALEMSPITEFSASFRRAGEGKLYWPRPAGHPQIKFYNPSFGALISHDMTPTFRQQREPTCDTVMYVFFCGEQLRYVKYYYGPTDTGSGSENNFEECMYVGSWFSRTWSGYGVPGMFYTSEIDDRQEVYNAETYTEVTSRDIGYTTVKFGDDLVFPYLSYLFRVKSFATVSRTTSYSLRRFNSAICIPHGSREAYFYALRDYYRDKEQTTTYGYRQLTDPNKYTGWRNFPGWTGFLPAGCQASDCYQRADHPAGCGKVDDRRVWEPYREESPCSEFADSGGWATPCQQIESMVYHIDLPGIPTVHVDAESSATLTVQLVSSSALTPTTTSIQKAKGDGSEFIGSRWFRFSPDDDGFMDRMWVRQNMLGDGDAIVFSKDINEYLNGSLGKPNDHELIGKNTTFIGVING